MDLINGKFYQGEKEVPLEFGNKEQIKLIQQAEQRTISLKGEGLEPDYEAEDRGEFVIVEFSFKCICGCHVQFKKQEFLFRDWMFLCSDNYTSISTECKECSRKYRTYAIEDEYGWSGVVVKLK